MQVKFYNVFYNFYFICINLKKFFQKILSKNYTYNIII